MDRGELLVLRDLLLLRRRPRTVDGVHRLALGRVVAGRRREPLPDIRERIERKFEARRRRVEIDTAIGQLPVELRALDACGVLDELLGVPHPQLGGLVVHGVAMDLHQCAEDVVVVKPRALRHVI